jgi:exosortase A
MVNIPAPPMTAISTPASSTRDRTVAMTALAIGIFAFVLVFRSEIASAFEVWNNSDAYSHCFLVLPVAAYLAWERRRSVAAAELSPAPWIALLAIPVAGAWFMAERIGIMEGRQLMAMTLFQIMVASILGLRTWRALSVPLLYLFFLVPFGEFLVPPLQNLVVHFTKLGLDLLGVQNFSDGVVIEIPEGTFIVHQACSGLRFLIASAAFGVLCACLLFRSGLRRFLFISFSIFAAIIGNCLRVLGTILIAHFIGNTQAVETSHVLWGWLFYLIIGLVVILVGLPFRQEVYPIIPAFPARHSRRLAAGAILGLSLMLIIAIVPRAFANYLDHVDTGSADVTGMDRLSLSGCAIAPMPAKALIPWGDGGIRADSSMAYRCGEDVFVLTLRRYPARIGARALFSTLKTAVEPPGGDIILQSGDIVGPGSLIWRVTNVNTDTGYGAIATALWLDGHPSGGGILARFVQAFNSFRRRAVSPVVAVVTYSGRPNLDDAQRGINRFLSKTAPLAGLVSSP